MLQREGGRGATLAVNFSFYLPIFLSLYLSIYLSILMKLVSICLPVITRLIVCGPYVPRIASPIQGQQLDILEEGGGRGGGKGKGTLSSK